MLNNFAVSAIVRYLVALSFVPLMSSSLLLRLIVSTGTLSYTVFSMSIRFFYVFSGRLSYRSAFFRKGE